MGVQGRSPREAAAATRVQGELDRRSSAEITPRVNLSGPGVVFQERGAPARADFRRPIGPKGQELWKCFLK